MILTWNSYAVGGDLIHADDKFEKAIDFKFKGVFWFCANELPKFGGDQGDWVYLNHCLYTLCIFPLVQFVSSIFAPGTLSIQHSCKMC